ncbi:MAG: excinuclease ABC subunit UvrC [Planctomycetota bacterium]
MDRSALQKKIAEFPPDPGVYLMKDASGIVLYIGKAKSLRHRVAGYFQPSSRHEEKIARMLETVADVDCLPAPSEVDAFLMESRFIKDVQPKYNVRLRDDKTFPFLQVTLKEDYPRVEITRDPVPGARLFGPFTSSSDLRASLASLQRVFRFRTCTLDIRDDPATAGRRFARPCLLYYVKCCLGPCAGLCSRDAYSCAVRNFIRFLSGRRNAVLTDLERRMLKASRELRFEDAAAFRDEMKALKSLDKRSRFTDNPQFYSVRVDFGSAGPALAETFSLPAPPRLIEGIDVSNIQGCDAVGSLVTFIDGAPWKSGYRRYKIRIPQSRGSDDCAMIAEVVSRRYSRLLAEGARLPDLVLIDGGPGQLHAASAALSPLLDKRGQNSFSGAPDAPPMRSAGEPFLVSIAKKEEELFSLRSPEPVVLHRRHPGLRLLQYVRDEAHRFALHYHHILRTKRTFASAPSRTPQGRGSRVRVSVSRPPTESAGDSRPE